MADELTVDPTFEPLAWQEQFLLNEARALVAVADYGAGKTWALAYGAIENLKSSQMYGNSLVVSPTHFMSENVMECAKHILKMSDTDFSVQSRSHSILTGRGQVFFGFMDNAEDNPQYRYAGMELQYVGFDGLNYFHENAWKYMQSRLRPLDTKEKPIPYFTPPVKIRGVLNLQDLSQPKMQWLLDDILTGKVAYQKVTSFGNPHASEEYIKLMHKEVGEGWKS